MLEKCINFKSRFHHEMITKILNGLLFYHYACSLSTSLAKRVVLDKQRHHSANIHASRPGEQNNILRVRHVPQWDLGPKFSKQGSFFERFSLGMDGFG